MQVAISKLCNGGLVLYSPAYNISLRSGRREPVLCRLGRGRMGALQSLQGHAKGGPARASSLMKKITGKEEEEEEEAAAAAAAEAEAEAAAAEADADADADADAAAQKDDDDDDDEDEGDADSSPAPAAPAHGPLRHSRSDQKTHQYTYLFAAIASTVGITSLAAGSVYYRFAWQMKESGGDIPYTEMFGTFSLALGAAVGMEFWARWAHRALWHASLWHMHESHHQAREGPFELNDIFAIINAIPAITLMAYGFLNKGLIPGLCFGAGLGITTFGIAYMFVHDGLVHHRFPVGPIANVPYFRKVAAAHQLHHANKFHGVPYGLFLGPKEVQDVGGQEELDKVLQRSKRNASKISNG